MRKQPTPQQQQRAGAGRSQPQTCPNCHALVQDGDIICVACGTNLLTGQKVAREQQESVAVAPSLGLGRTVWIVVGVVLAVFVIVAIVLAFHLLSKDPLKKAEELAAAGNYLEAADVLKDYLEQYSGDAQAHFALGRIYVKMDRFSDAAGSYEKASELDPANLEAAMNAVAGLAASPGPGAVDRQVAVLNRVVGEFPDNARAWYLLALGLGRQGDFANQINALRKVAGAGTPYAGKMSQSLGIAMALRGDYENAGRELALAAQQQSNNADALAAGGLVANLRDQPEEAEEKLRAALEKGTTIGNEALVRLALMLVAQGRFDAADEYLVRAMAEETDNPLARFCHALCLQAKGMTSEAVPEYEAVAEAGGPLAPQALVHVAALYLAQENTVGARSAIERAVEAGNNKPTAATHTLQGRILASEDEEDRAREAFRKALRMNSDYAPAHLENGLLYIKQGVFEEGIEELERYLALVGPDVEGTEAVEIEALVGQLKETVSGRGSVRG